MTMNQTQEPGLRAEAVLALGCTLGEGPVWDVQRACLWLTDIKQQAIHRFDPASGAHARFDAPGQVGWVLPTDDGRLLAGLQAGLALFDPETGVWDAPVPIEGEPEGNRLNDACVAPDGTVHFGSMDDAETALSGRFHRFSRGTVEPAGPDAISITNGPAISPDGTRIYFTDTLGQRILTAAIGADGSIAEATLFADTAQDFPEAWPDGPVCDSEGYVWTGLWNGWGVARYAPDGTLLGKVELPVANVTKVAFGGDDLRRVFVTTARKGLDDAALAAQPEAGHLFAFDSPVAGVGTVRVPLA